MRNLMIDGATRRNVGAGQGYRGIAIRDELIDDPVNGPNTPNMVMGYEPMPDELARLAAGAPILLSILGRVVPPHLLEVGEVPDVVVEPPMIAALLTARSLLVIEEIAQAEIAAKATRHIAREAVLRQIDAALSPWREARKRAPQTLP